MSSGYKVVNEVHVGGEEQVTSEWQTNRVVFHHFSDLPSKRGECTQSPVFECHGLKWTVDLYPGGNKNFSGDVHAMPQQQYHLLALPARGQPKSSEEDVNVSVFLSSKSCTDTNQIRAKFRIRVPSARKMVGGEEACKIFSPARNESSWGEKDYAKREDVLDSSKNYLVDGNLTVEVDIQVMLDEPPVWTPTNNISADMLNILESADAESADVVFKIGEGNKATARSRKKASYPSRMDERKTFYAHKLILSVRAPILAALADDCSPGTAIPISDVRPDLFRMLLRFVYGGEVPGRNVLSEKGRDIIRAADRFRCIGLKLAAEAELAFASITVDNASELILFADATGCALLKEVATEFFVRNAQDVTASEGFAQVKESPALLTELLLLASKKRPASSDSDGERDFKRMRVSTLRRKLDGKGLDVDGSKEMLVSRLAAADAVAFARAEMKAETKALAETTDNEDEDE